LIHGEQGKEEGRKEGRKEGGNGGRDRREKGTWREGGKEGGREEVIKNKRNHPAVIEFNPFLFPNWIQNLFSLL
jgi:hypothetical protein